MSKDKPIQKESTPGAMTIRRSAKAIQAASAEVRREVLIRSTKTARTKTADDRPTK